MTTVEISTTRLMKAGDVKAVVTVHLDAFQGFFLSFLGSAFLRELYRAILLDPSGIAYVYEQQGEVVGFVAGTDQPARFYRRLLRQRWWRFVAVATLPAIRKPSIIPRLLRALTLPRQASDKSSVGTLMSIAVSPQVQSQGIGRALVSAFLQEAAQRKLRIVNLTTDTNNNELTNRFYQRQGFNLVRTFTTPEGRQMNEYQIVVPNYTLQSQQ